MIAQTLLRDLAGDDAVARGNALSALPEALKARAFDEAELATLATHLELLARDARPQTRRAVAHALRYLRHDVVDDVLRALLADDNALVAKAAQTTEDARRDRAHVEALPVAVGERVQRLLDEVRVKHDKRARDAAVRVGLAYTDFMVSALNHQVAAAMTPIAASLETLELLLPESASPDALALLRTAQDHLEQVAAILESARSFVKRDAPSYRRTNVRALVDRVVETVGGIPLAAANGLATTLEISPELELEAVPSALREALVNVVKNAIEASGGRRPIPLRIAARAVKGNIELTVRDEGCGMAQEACDGALFRPFGSQKEGGTGLGMPLVKKIVELDHGGKISVRSARGEGTTVTILLPAQQGF